MGFSLLKINFINIEGRTKGLKWVELAIKRLELGKVPFGEMNTASWVNKQ